MKSGAQLSFMTLALCIYCALVTFRPFNGQTSNEMDTKPLHFSKKGRKLNNFSSNGADLRPSTDATNLTPSKLNKSCLWIVMVWKFPYRPKLHPGHYFCPETNCTVQYIYSDSYETMEKSDVVVLHGMGSWSTTKINSFRRKDQLLTMMTWERPKHHENKRGLSMFNWTMTYSYKSDFPIPYGRRIMNPEVGKQRFAPRKRNWAHGKTGLAIWIAHNCKSTEWPRKDFIYKLSTFMKIDKFGKCGTLSCGDKREDEHCLSKITSYKFYIAFEKASCEDYITEKMWRNALGHDAVPIVYGAPKSDYERLAPRNSFIHISDFNNMSSLASYIQLLDRNDTLYNSYFDWKSDYHIQSAKFSEVIDETMLCSISTELVNLPRFRREGTGTQESAEWFAKTCVDVPWPDMV